MFQTRSPGASRNCAAFRWRENSPKTPPKWVTKAEKRAFNQTIPAAVRPSNGTHRQRSLVNLVIPRLANPP